MSEKSSIEKITSIQEEEVFQAARQGDLEKINFALNRGFDIQKRNEKGHSVLMLAAYNGHYNLAEALISRGADVNSVDDTGNSILMGVVFKGHNRIFDLLVTSGADLEFQNSKGQSALDFAVMFGRRDLILRINKALKLNRSSDRMEQVKTWVKQIRGRSL